MLNIMGRELSSFTDLQKTLAQLGFNSGSSLIKLSYKTSEKPLEEAMAQIQAYFDEVDPQPAKPQEQPSSTEAQEQPQQELEKEKVQPEWLDDQQMQEGEPPTSTTQQQDAPTDTASQPHPIPTTTVSNRPVSVYRPPSSAGPAPIRHNESDYVPTVEHAQIHQKLLQQESRNRRLPTDAELAAKQKEQREELQNIESVEIKIRFPDQSAISSRFKQSDTSRTLYGFVRECLVEELRSELFILRNPGVRDKDGGAVLENDKKLILELQLRGRVLVVFGWDEKASSDARGMKEVLRQDLRQQAREYIAPVVSIGGATEDDKGIKVDLAPKQEEKGDGVKGKMPKWLKGLGKR